MAEFKPRTDAEILARIRAVEKRDFMGIEMGDLIPALSFDAARPFLKDTATAEDWEKRKATPLEQAGLIAAILGYLGFAWGKANNCRGLSASRSISHFRTWLWLLGEDAAADALDDDCELYGKPQLRAISEHFGIDWRALDNGRWTNDEGDDGEPADAVDRVVLPFKSAPMPLANSAADQAAAAP